jgi:hypothetical protein
MKSQSCCSCLPPRTANSNPSTPWSRYRHGCDPPPDGQRPSKACCSTHTSDQASWRVVHHNNFSSFSHFSPFQNTHWLPKPQLPIFFRRAFPCHQFHQRRFSPSCMTWSPTVNIIPMTCTTNRKNTARCTKDPWLQVRATGARSAIQIGADVASRMLQQEFDACIPFNGYVPDDLRQALPNVDKQSFPRTGTIISNADKQRLSAEYERVNPSYNSNSNSNLGIQTQLSSQVFTAIAPRYDNVQKPSTQLKIFSRGTEPSEQTQPEGQTSQELLAIVPPSRNEGMDAALPLPQAAITFDLPIHVLSMTGEDTLVKAGVYEVEPILDLQLSLAREGQSAILLPATVGTHRESLKQSVALLMSGESNDVRHLVFLTPDGKRFDAVGSTSGITSRGIGMAVPLPDRTLQTAIIKASAQAVPPPCRPNPYPVGPRNLPVPCTSWSGQVYTGDTPAGVGFSPSTPVPYLDGTNMLNAFLDKTSGAFRVVHPPDACYISEIKVKWQLAP